MYENFYDDAKHERLIFCNDYKLLNKNYCNFFKHILFRKQNSTATVRSEDLSSCHRQRNTNACVCESDDRVISSFQYENGHSRRCIPKFLEKFNIVSEGIILKINLTGNNLQN